MKDYNQEYFYVKRSGNIYPLLQYAQGGGNAMEVFDEIPLDETKIRVVCFAQPIPHHPELGDHHFLTENAPVISKRLKEVLESFNLRNIQFLPVIIKNIRGEEHADYYIIHAINFIKCMDREKSIWTPSRYDKDWADRIDKLVLDNRLLDEIPLENRFVFSLKENNLKVLYHQSVVEKILEIGPTGLTAYRLSEWDSKLPFIEEYVEKSISKK